MKMMNLSIQTSLKTELIDITKKIQETLKKLNFQDGICFIFVPHTTAAITINENADPSVSADMLNVLNSVIPWNGNYQHIEGNSAAHVKASLIGSSEIIAVENGKPVLGTWQGIYFCEFDGPRDRNVFIKCLPNQTTG